MTPTRDLTFPETIGNSVHAVTPRSSLAYDLFGDGKDGAAGESQQVSARHRAHRQSRRRRQRRHADVDRCQLQFTPDCNLLNLQSQDLRSSGGDFCATVSNLNFGQPASVTAFDEATRFGNREYNWEFSSACSISCPACGRGLRLLPAVGRLPAHHGNRALTAADYDEFSIVAPRDPRLPGGGCYTISGLYDVKPNQFGVVDNYETLAKNFGEQHEHWNGVDLTVNARLEGGGAGRPEHGRTSTDNCDVVSKIGANPSKLYCHVDTLFLTQVKLLGTYSVSRIGMQFAATLQSSPGPQIMANYLATNANVLPTLGRPCRAVHPTSR